MNKIEKFDVAITIAEMCSIFCIHCETYHTYCVMCYSLLGTGNLLERANDLIRNNAYFDGNQTICQNCQAKCSPVTA